MIFTTYWFSLFVCAVFPLYWLARPGWLRLGLLLAACFTFHAHFAGAAGMLPIIILSATTYLAGLSRSRAALVAAMILPVLALVFYKYTHFVSLQLIGLIHPAWGSQVDHLAGALLPVTPPLAVSFFVFEFVHYLYDVSHGSPSIRNPAHFCAFTFFFPSLVAGPIKRYQPFLQSLGAGLAAVPIDDVKRGLIRVALGLFKKVVLADNLTEGLSYWHERYHHLTLGVRWIFLGALGLRILFDFSGYSDIAIGLARMMGIGLPENFRWPYLATSVTDFWHRWHISLSTWVRDYVYIPLGGGRSGVARKILNGFIAFALCGLWHGPAWNFAFWGLYHGAGLAVSSNYRTLLGPSGPRVAAFFVRAPLAGRALTLLFVLIGWLFFFYPFPEAVSMLGLLVRPAP